MFSLEKFLKLNLFLFINIETSKSTTQFVLLNFKIEIPEIVSTLCTSTTTTKHKYPLKVQQRPLMDNNKNKEGYKLN